MSTQAMTEKISEYFKTQSDLKTWVMGKGRICKIQFFVLCVAMLSMLAIGMSGCSIDDDDNENNVSRLIGTWRLEGVYNRPAGVMPPHPHWMEIKETDSQFNYMKRIGGTITIILDDGSRDTALYWTIVPMNDSIYNKNYPIFCWHFGSKEYPGEPYAYEVDKTTLKLRHLSPNNSEPLSETMVYKRISFKQIK